MTNIKHDSRIGKTKKKQKKITHCRFMVRLNNLHHNYKTQNKQTTTNRQKNNKTAQDKINIY